MIKIVEEVRDMRDPVGNEIDKITENSIQMRAFVMADELDKAVWIMAHAVVGKRTKEQMKEAINKATNLILEVRKELVGR